MNTLNTNSNASGRNTPMMAVPIDLRNAQRDPDKHDAVNRQGTGVGKDGDPAHTVTSACVHGVATAMTGSGIARVADPVEVARSLDTNGGYATNQGGNVVAQPVAVAEVGMTLTSGGRGADPVNTDLVVFHNRQDPDVSGSVTHPLGAKDNGMAVAHTVCLGSDPIHNKELAMPITRRNGDPGVVQTAMQVRRLTPVECERLQGFPDGYTDIRPRGKDTPDGPRYKALGNSMAVPVMRWIGERIAKVEDISEG